MSTPDSPHEHPAHAGPVDEQSASSRERILAAASKLFAERGIAGATMAKIAQHSGVSKGLAYHYFDSKEAIIQEIVESRWQQIHHAYLEIEEIPDPRQRLLAMVREALARLEAEPERERLYVSLFLDPAMQPLLARAKANRADALSAMYRAVNRLMAELGPSRREVGTLLFTALLNGLTILSATSLDWDAGELAAAVADLFDETLP